MKQCTVTITPHGLLSLLGFPPDCQARVNHNLAGQLVLEVDGFGSDTSNGEKPVELAVIITQREIDGERWLKTHPQEP